MVGEVGERAGERRARLHEPVRPLRGRRVRTGAELSAAGSWRPQCYVCGRFVALEAYDVSYDYWTGTWEEGYTKFPTHGGPDRAAVLTIRERRKTETQTDLNAALRAYENS